MELYLIKMANGNYAPAYESDREASERIKPGNVVKGSITTPRNLQFHKKYFAMMNLMYSNQERFESFEDFRGYYQMRAGFYKTVLTPKSKLYWPVSISFAKMDDLEFEEVYNKVLDKLLEDIPMNRQDIEKELIEFM